MPLASNLAPKRLPIADWRSTHMPTGSPCLCAGDTVLLSSQFGGAVQTIYSGTTSEMSSAQSQVRCATRHRLHGLWAFNS